MDLSGAKRSKRWLPVLQDQSGESPFSQDQATLPTCPTDRSGIASFYLVGEEQLEQSATPNQTHQRNNFFNDSFWAPIRLQLLRDSGRLYCSRLQGQVMSENGSFPPADSD
uniref:(northern house mosquito) hypothetical protein n=1 Tax=Culex pipiens TaxID=7175 RepID=A0A8D8BAM6_CULPI